MTAFSGVRSSCDMLARNSDLCRLATSSSLRLAPPARGTARALWMATADWLASVSSRSTVGRSNAPGRASADDEDADDLLLPAAAGRRAASASRRPASASRCGSEGSRVQVGGLPRAAARRRAPDERLVEVDADRAAARPTSSALVPAHVRSANSPARGVELEDRAARRCRRARTARATIVVSTSSSVEARADTAWLISPSACSSSTERASSALALLQAWNSSTFWIAIARLRREGGERASMVRSSNGSTSSRQSTITPTTRSPASIGTPSIVR